MSKISHQQPSVFVTLMCELSVLNSENSSEDICSLESCMVKCVSQSGTVFVCMCECVKSEGAERGQDECEIVLQYKLRSGAFLDLNCI